MKYPLISYLGYDDSVIDDAPQMEESEFAERMQRFLATKLLTKEHSIYAPAQDPHRLEAQIQEFELNHSRVIKTMKAKFPYLVNFPKKA